MEFVIENNVLIKYNGPCTRVEIPEGVTEIGAGAFFGSLKAVIYGIEGSYAQKYASEKWITVKVIKP